MAKKRGFSIFSEPLISIQYCIRYLIVIFFTVLVTFLVYYSTSVTINYEYNNHGSEEGIILGNFTTSNYSILDEKITWFSYSPPKIVDEKITGPSYSSPKNIEEEIIGPQCDLFSGKWVFDNSSTYPLYKDYECKFMFDDLACEKYGRKDLDYQRWRWQPHDCDLPRFNATKMLERLRNKRLVLVGDSVNRNQWVSLMCMLEGSIPTPFKSMKLMGNLYTFKAMEYNASIDYYWAPLMVESAADDPSSHHTNARVIRVNSIEKHAIHWGNADVLVFNSYLWWQVSEVQLVWGSLDKPRKVKKADNRYSYKMALKTWSKWITTHLQHSNTKLFFMSMPATHMRAIDWGKNKYHSCLNETQPITKKDYWGSGSDRKMFHILEDEINNLMKKGINIHLLNITQLSEYRKDGHPTIYRKLWRPLSKEKLANPLLYADCTHWCLPGVPDIWNQILYAHLV